MLWIRSLFQGFDEAVSLPFPIPKPGTETPALPSLLRVEAFSPADVDGFDSSGLTVSYGGGGGEATAGTSVEACLEGSLGGSLG